MDPPPASFRDLLEIFRLAGSEWIDRRQWKTAVPRGAPPGAGHGTLHLEQPAFCYFWEARGSRVETTLATGNEVAAGPGRTLAVEIGGGRIRIHIPGRQPAELPAIDPGTHAQFADLVTECRTSRPRSDDDWQHELRTIGCAMRAAALAGEAVRRLGEPEAAEPRSGRKDRLVEQLHEWLRPNLDQSLKLADAATRFDKSPRQLIRILKDATGAGFAEHVTMHRLAHARSLLMRTDRSVMEVARASGFNSREQFIRAFSKAFGWTPLQFRKSWSRATLGGDDLADLCQLSGRNPVTWLPAREIGTSPAPGFTGEPNTLVVTNALHEPVELFRVTPQGRLARFGILEAGALVFVHRDHGRSVWHARAPGSGRSRSFTTPRGPALAVISAEALGT